MKNRVWILSFLLVMISTLSCIKTSQKNSPWHHPLYMANNDYWRQRIPVTIRNNTHRELLGEPLEMLIGTNRGQVPLAGTLAEAIRVTTSKGDELMFRLSDSEGKQIEKGVVPEGSKIVIPVECKADTLAISYIYFDNPSAWAVGDYLKTNGKENDSIVLTVLKTEKLSLKEIGKTDQWYDDNNNDRYTWQSRTVIKTINYSPKKIAGKVVCVGMEGVLNRLHVEINKNTAIQVTAGSRAIPFYRMGNNILFTRDIPGLSEQINYVYFNSEDSLGGNLNVTNVTNLSDLGKNLLSNPDFESRNLTGWKSINNIENIKVSTDSKEGAGYAQLVLAAQETAKEIGLERQKIPFGNYGSDGWVGM